MGKTRQQVEVTVRNVVDFEIGEKASLADGGQLFTDAGADSLDQIELVMELEKEFDIDIPDEVAERVRSINSATEVVWEALGHAEVP